MGDNKKYLDGQMTPEELEQHTTRLLRAKFDKERSTRWQQLLKEQHGIDRQPASGNTSRYRWLIPAAAVAASLLLLWFIKPFSSSNQDASAVQLAQQYLATEHFPHDDVRKSPEQHRSLYLSAKDAYSQKDYAKSRQYYQQIIVLPQATAGDSFYLALSHSYLGEYNAAINLLQPLQADASPNNEYYDSATWFLAVTHLLKGEEELAKEYLKTFVQMKGWENMKARARKMLENIE